MLVFSNKKTHSKISVASDEQTKLKIKSPLFLYFITLMANKPLETTLWLH